MAVQSFATDIKSINLYKFGAVNAANLHQPNGIDSLDIKPQVQEITFYESIFSPVMKCELAIIDYIGLFTNFPLTGNEIIIITYTNVGDSIEKKYQMAIESITDISVDSNNRATGYIINCVSVETLSNTLGTVQQSYKGTSIQIAKEIFQEHIIERTREYFPSYIPNNIFASDNETIPKVVVVPNMYPISAINMVQSLAVSEVNTRNTYLFYQNSRGFHFRTLQGLIQDQPNRDRAHLYSYKYFSDEIAEIHSEMQNEERVVSNLKFNKRHSTIQKIALGYFNNNLFEINMAQKAIHTTRTNIDEHKGIYGHSLDTDEYEDWTTSFNEGDEKSNRVKYTISTYPENDDNFPIYRTRDRWGLDVQAKVALSQVDLTIVIPGTNRFAAGDMFYLEIPEFHGFNDMEDDDLISGLYLITDIKQIVVMGGYQSTVLRINKDSYKSTVDRPSRY